VILVANKLLWTPPSPFIRAMRVPHGFNVADREIVEQVQAGDLVVTADIPLASEVIGRGGHALDPRGTLYTADNIQERLAHRDFGWTSCAGSGVDRGPPFRPTDTHAFANQPHAAAPRGPCRLDPSRQSDHNGHHVSCPQEAFDDHGDGIEAESVPE
jgi:uncharacterized protein YaiI (UPF0178 family)